MSRSADSLGADCAMTNPLTIAGLRGLAAGNRRTPCQPRARTRRKLETLKCRQTMSKPAVIREAELAADRETTS